MLVLYLNEDNLVEVDGLRDRVADDYVNDATATITLKDRDNAVVTGVNGLAMSYVAGSDGDYRAVIPETVSLTNGARYWLEVSAESSSRNAFRRIECVAEYHDET